MTVKELIERIEKVKGIKHSEEQLKILESKGGLVVLAGAGSGKTTTITELLYKRIYFNEIDPNKLLCTTYSKSGAREMEEKFNRLCKDLNLGDFKISVKTLHACYYQILWAMGYEFNVCSDYQSKQFIKQALSNLSIKVAPGDDLDDYVMSCISYRINRLLTWEALSKSYLFEPDRIDIKDLERVHAEYMRIKNQAQLVDFDDLQWQVFILLYKSGEQCRNWVLDYVNRNWSYFCIDEFQDTSAIQYMILKAFVSRNESDRLVVIGDDDQSIYQWRGTDPNIILESVEVDYDLQVYKLPTNYRCKSEIVDFASKSVVCLSHRADKDLRAFNEGGKVEILRSSLGYSLANMSRVVKDYIKNLIVNEGVDANDIAVLCRNNNEVCILNNMLAMDGIFTECTEGMKFTKSPLYKDFYCAFNFIEDTTNHIMVGQYLWKYVPFLGIKGARMVSNLMNDTGLSLKDALGFILFKLSDYSSFIKKDYSKLNISAKIVQKMNAQYFSLNRQAVVGLYGLYNSLTNTNKKNEDTLSELYTSIATSVDYLYRTPERNRILTGYKNYFSELSRNYSMEDLMNKLRTCEQLDSGSFVINDSKVHLSTYHGAKGLEWRHVILFCCDNYVVPGFYDVKNMVERGYSVNDLNEYLDCERRLYYVGCTRAKDKLAIIGDMNNPSPFVLESTGILENKGSNNHDIIDLCIHRGNYDLEVKKNYFNRCIERYTSKEGDDSSNAETKS